MTQPPSTYEAALEGQPRLTLSLDGLDLATVEQVLEQLTSGFKHLDHRP